MAATSKELWVEYRVVWTVAGSDKYTERVDNWQAAIRLVLLRERFERRFLRDEEYQLLQIERYGNKGQAYTWYDDQGRTIHHYVDQSRLGRR